MKKLVLSLAAFAALTANGQTRLALFEEFSGENCAPCAQANPGLWTLISGNPTKALLIKYQSPIPSAGPIYNQYKTVTQARMSYYNVPFAPYGRLDGTILGTGSNAGHVSFLTQTAIDADAAVAAPFNISVTHAWNATGDSVTANITVNCVSNFAPTGGQLKLRVGMIEHLVYATAPGTNGEKDFHNVVREMYPDANGTAISNSWTSGQSQNFTIKGKVPAYVDKTGEVRMVVWIQDDNNKAIAQAAVSTEIPVALDVASSAIAAPNSLMCTNGNASFVTNVTIKNTGTSPLTSAKIYYSADGNGTWQMQPWTGTLAAGATTSVTLPAVSLAAGQHYITDSVAMPNNQTDINSANNVTNVIVVAQNTTPNALPLTTGFENGGTMPTNYTLYDLNANGMNWVLAKSSSGNVGHNNSAYVIYHPNFGYPAGETNLILLPTPDMPAGQKAALDFYVAYAQYQAENDKLEVVYSTNCGQNWTSVWSKAGADLKTAAATTSSFVPTQAQWRKESVDMSNVPTGAMVAFRATSDYGNNLFIDDVNMRTGDTATGVATIAVVNALQLAPNPAKDLAKLSFDLKEAGKVQVSLFDAVGRMVSTVADQNMTAGKQQFDINTANLASGVYNIKITTDKGSMTERLSVIK